VSIPVNRMCPDSGDVRLDLFYHRFHGIESSE
jgi:hypothetical protein